MESNKQISQEGKEALEQADQMLDNAFDSLKDNEENPQQSVNSEPIVDDSSENDNFLEKEDPPKYVETDNPDIQKRINYLYKQVKSSDERNELLVEHNKKLAEKLEEIENQQRKYSTDIENSRDNNAIIDLKNQIRQAREDGEEDR